MKKTKEKFFLFSGKVKHFTLFAPICQYSTPRVRAHALAIKKKISSVFVRFYFLFKIPPEIHPCCCCIIYNIIYPCCTSGRF